MPKNKNLFRVSTDKTCFDFQYYSGPMGGDMNQSIRDGEARSIKGDDPSPNDRDMPRYWPPAQPGAKRKGRRT